MQNHNNKTLTKCIFPIALKEPTSSSIAYKSYPNKLTGHTKNSFILPFPAPILSKCYYRQYSFRTLFNSRNRERESTVLPHHIVHLTWSWSSQVCMMYLCSQAHANGTQERKRRRAPEWVGQVGRGTQGGISRRVVVLQKRNDLEIERRQVTQDLTQTKRL